MKTLRWLGIPAALLVAAPAGAQAVKVDPALPDYRPVSGISGSIKSIGSDTLNNTTALWAEGFMAAYPNVKVEVEGKGSATAPTALIAGTASFGPMSRPMKQEELDKFEEKFGYEPVGLAAAVDMLAVYVHKDNPLEGLTLQQVDAIFSKNRKGGFESDLTGWGELGLGGVFAKKSISLYGRNSASGTYGFFKEKALFKGDYKSTVKEQPGSSGVVQSVGSDLFGMGYSGMGYQTADVRALPIAPKAKSPFVEALPANAYSREYPLWRMLFIYVNRAPNEQLDPLRREFVRYIFSKQGQLDVMKSGYLPMPAKSAERMLALVGLEPYPEAGEKQAIDASASSGARSSR